MHAATVFGNLQSFMRQELDQAMATQALWHTLSSRLRVSSRPEGQLGKGLPSGRGPLGSLSCLLPAPCLSFPTWVGGQRLKQVSLTFPCPAILTHLLSTSWAGM